MTQDRAAEIAWQVVTEPWPQARDYASPIEFGQARDAARARVSGIIRDAIAAAREEGRLTRAEELLDEIDRLRGSLNAAREESRREANAWRPTHQHRKGEQVELINTARIQSDEPLSDMDEVVVYRDHLGRLWARRSNEWQARFTTVADKEPQDE